MNMQVPRVVLSMLAKTLHSTKLLDRGYWFFDRTRSKFVRAWASDAFYDVYNEVTYSRQEMYRPGTKAFQSTLLPFEERMLSRYFPSPPGTVLIGAAGGGREAFALAQRGYQVVAFEPVRVLAAEMANACGELRVETLVGRYEDLPILSSLAQPPVAVDLRARAPFEAAIMGWASLSHLRTDERCINTFRQIGTLTRGPILVSCYPGHDGRSSGFSATIGHYRGFSGAQMRALAERAGLEVVHVDDEDNWPHAVVRACATRVHTIATPRD
jgi:hypothetical protein